ncbi:MAG TPA: bacteriohemerythrin [Anaeromyxobacter sp.]
MKLEWTPAMSVGNEEIDAQHQELFRRAGKLLEGLHRGEPGEIGELVDYLHRYAVTHFGAEEAAMRDARYAGYARHKAEHDRFIGDLLVLAAEHEQKGGGAFLALRVDHWLRGWLREHVSGTDTELARFLVRRSA